MCNCYTKPTKYEKNILKNLSLSQKIKKCSHPAIPIRDHLPRHHRHHRWWVGQIIPRTYVTRRGRSHHQINDHQLHPPPRLRSGVGYATLIRRNWPLLSPEWFISENKSRCLRAHSARVGWCWWTVFFLSLWHFVCVRGLWTRFCYLISGADSRRDRYPYSSSSWWWWFIVSYGTFVYWVKNLMSLLKSGWLSHLEAIKSFGANGSKHVGVARRMFYIFQD